MNTILNNLKKYFMETPKEIIIKEADVLREEWGNVGPTVDEFLKIQEKKCYIKKMIFLRRN